MPDRDAALEGARAILVERWAEDADLVGELREQMWRRGRLTATYRDGRGGEGDTAAAKFSDYGAFDEKFTRLPSHRILAVLRGETEEVLALSLDPLAADDEETAISDVYLSRIAAAVGVADRGRPADRWLTDAVRWAWRTRILSRLVVDLRVRLREVAEEGAVLVFAGNLRDLLLAAPAGARPTLGLDPGLRTGVKVAVIDGTGKVVATDTVHPHVPRRQWEASRDPPGRAGRASTASSWSPSATARPRARPTPWCATSSPASPTSGSPPRWSPRPARRCTPPPSRPRPSCPTSTSRCAARSRSRGACRTRWPSS